MIVLAKIKAVQAAVWVDLQNQQASAHTATAATPKRTVNTVYAKAVKRALREMNESELIEKILTYRSKAKKEGKGVNNKFFDLAELEAYAKECLLIIKLKDEENKSFRQIGNILGVTRSAAHQRYQRIKKYLK